MHRAHFVRRLPIFLNYRAACEFTHAHDMITFIHTALLNRIHSRVHITTAAVKISGMHMDNQWFSSNLLGKYTSRVGQPIMAVDDIKIQTMCQHTGYSFVVIDLFYQVIWITTRKTNTTQLVCTNTTIVISNTIAQVEILFSTHSTRHALLYVVVVILFPYYRHAVSANDTKERLVFITPWFRNDECDIHIFLLRHTACQTITGGT